MFATAASVAGGSLAALTAMARSETVQSAQREAAAELRGVVATTGEVATDRAMLHGFCTMSDIVTLDRPLPVEVSVTAAARAAGGVAAMLLPTVHQADGWKNLAIGQAIGDRLAATVSQMTQDPSLMGCEEAVQALEPFASASWSISRFLGVCPPRSLVLSLTVTLTVTLTRTRTRTRTRTLPAIATQVPRAGFSWVTHKLKGSVGIPLVATNRINTPEIAEQVRAS